MVEILAAEHVHHTLDCGVEFAADVLPARNTVAIGFRLLAGVADEPEDLNGIAAITESTLSKGTQAHSGREIADAFDLLGARWSSHTGRQTTVFRAVCLPEYVPDVVDLLAEMLRTPAFEEEACRVAVDLALKDYETLDDHPDDLLRILINRMTLGSRLGRYVGGTPESLQRIDAARVWEHWTGLYGAGRLQIAIAGPVNPDDVASQIDARFAGFGDATPAGRAPVDVALSPTVEHRQLESEQQYIALVLPGVPRTAPEFRAEQVLIGVLSGGMGARLFTEVREKQGLVYYVGAWQEHPRGAGMIHLSASTTPQRCDQTYRTLVRELERLREDLTDEEIARARDGLIAQFQTEDDLTRARASSLSDDLFHYGRPIDPLTKLQAIEAVTPDDVRRRAAALALDRMCVATVGPQPLDV